MFSLFKEKIMSTNVNIDHVVKRYGDFTAINDMSFIIKDGEFFTLLGPSGCGKTTLLRMIAGFNSIEEGTIYFNDTPINNISPHKRDIGMVFQNYAIFPHLSVYENVEYGLKNRNVPAKERHDKIIKALETVQIEHLKDRMPEKLSGGQQQRVALARAIVIEPKILLMDEPLSNLDAKLRVHMRNVIKKLQRQLNITTVYVTHDQEEALAISDRIAVMDKGEIMQLDTPTAIYQKPENEFVANFIGMSNFIETQNLHDGNYQIADYTFKAPIKKIDDPSIMLSVRPEHVIISDDLNGPGIKGDITLSVFLGDFIYYEIELETGQIIEAHEYTQNKKDIREEGPIKVVFDTDSISAFTKDGKERINE